MNKRADPAPGQDDLPYGRPDCHFLFDAAPRTTYTLTSLAFNSRA
ncbi:hypothetical protein [Streptomyces sp. GbtcB6]|nr:hypothetical protein [Streptomyces sp. GbtcB6]